MSRVSSFDGEIGRGRRHGGNDSSSSRESSPARPRTKRSFSPVISDDDTATIGRTEENDDTPPPAERPVLRQSLAFSANPAQVHTYEATVAPPSKKSFLPGQEVTLPTKKKRQVRSKSGIKRPRRPDAYPGQTSRFRLETYDPTPSIEPPIAHGNGPYSSLYRGVVGAVAQDGQTPVIHSQGTASLLPNATNLISMDPPSSSSSPGPPPMNILHNPHTGRAVMTTSTLTPMLQNPVQALPVQPQAALNRGTTLIPSTPVEQRPPQQSNLQPQSRQSSMPLVPTTASHATYVTDTSLTIPERGSPGPYYRRDYEAREMTPPNESRRSSTLTNSKSASEGPGQKKGNRGPLRIVTVLIEDMRSSEPDPQLAEVKVPLKRSEDEDDGWWADAKDIAVQLQSGPSRIDGPARAFTMRGKYRQFILRVTADNKDEFVSANVAISPQKTLDVTVELLQPLGTGIKPRPVPRDPWYDDRSDDYMDADVPRRTTSTHKRQRSPSFDDYDRYSVQRTHSQSGTSKMPKHGRWGGASRKSPSPPFRRDRCSIPSNGEPDRRRQRNPLRRDSEPSYASAYHGASSPASATSSSPSRSRSHIATPTAYPRHNREDDDHAPADEPFIRAVDRLLHEDQNLSGEYYRVSAGHKTSDLLRQYEIVKKLIKKLVGRQPPGFHEIISEIHIARALEIENPGMFLSKCHETMSLLHAYGKNGTTHENPRVLEMINDQREHGPNVDMGKKLLRLLRAVDDAWKNDMHGSMLDGINPPGPDPYDKPGPYAPQSMSTPPTPTITSTTSPTTRQQSRGDSQSNSSSSSLLGRPAGSIESVAPVDKSRYTSRGKGMFVD